MAAAASQMEKGGEIMNIQLRKRHRFMWMIIGIGLPLLCLTAIENIPVRPTADIARHACPAAITNCGIYDVEHSHMEAFDAWLTKGDSTTVFQIDVLQPPKSAFTLVYVGSGDQPNESWHLLGAVEGMGSYSFQMNKSFGDAVVPITFYDALNKQVLNLTTRTVQ